MYRDGSIYSSIETVKAGIRNRFTAGIDLGPFLAGGAGAKEYVIAGPAPYPQPVPQVAVLTTNDVWKVAFTVGGGVQYLLRPHMLLKAEFRDYLTTFNRQELVPPRTTRRGEYSSSSRRYLA